MITKKIVFTLIALVLCIPVIALAQQTGGVPALREELQTVKTDLQTQINNIQLTPGPQGPAGPAGPAGATGATGAQGIPGVANGITRAVHGIVTYDGNWFGSGFVVTEVSCYVTTCCTNIQFTQPFTTTQSPTCTLTFTPSYYYPPTIISSQHTNNYYRVCYSRDDEPVLVGFHFICVE